MSQTTSSATVNRLASLEQSREEVIETPLGELYIVLSLHSPLLLFYNHPVITSTKAQKMQQKTRMEHHISINKLN
jgi:hypothetical protein